MSYPHINDLPEHHISSKLAEIVNKKESAKFRDIFNTKQNNEDCRKGGRPLLSHNDKLKKNNMLPFERVTPDRGGVCA